MMNDLLFWAFSLSLRFWSLSGDALGELAAL
jgi:hypothetical protein